MQKLKMNSKTIFIITWSVASIISLCAIVFVLYDLYKNSYTPVYKNDSELTVSNTKPNLDINMEKFNSIMKKLDDKSVLKNSNLKNNIFR